jgi:DUF2905 family protein
VGALLRPEPVGISVRPTPMDAPLNALPKLLMVAGAALFAVGGLLFVGQRLGLGRLPGDFSWQGKNFSFHFPLVTSLLVSVVLTLLINLWLGRSR